MTIDVSTPWHKASYDTFLNERLPALLAERLPLLSYAVESTGVYACRVTVTLGTPDDALDVGFDLPQPDEQGIFEIGGQRKVVIPTASRAELDQAEIRCAGEQLYDFVAARLGHAPADLPWDMPLVCAWLPLDLWVAEFMAGRGEMDEINWLAHHTHLRRLLVPEADDVIAPGQFGYVCPFEIPEGPNIGHVFTIAVGATIRDGHLVIVDERPEATLGLSASMVPLLEHDDPNRILMGANMLRQWIVQQVPEPAWVQTGSEPDALLSPDFWTGRNLLTAFVSWGPGTYEDAVVVSESCARRFDTPYALQIGDKMSNRHGTKGVVGQILPDDRMPYLPDGTPVDLVFNFANLHRRMNFGQIREAVLGNIARAEGKPAIVPPFGAPAADELRAHLVAAGLPESGMVTLTQGKDGPPLESPSTVGWVYWGRLYHLAKDKLHTYAPPLGAYAQPSSADTQPQSTPAQPLSTYAQKLDLYAKRLGALAQPSERWGQRTGEMETFMLRDLGAFENIRENLNTRAVGGKDTDTLARRLAAGPVEQSPPPTPLLAELAGRLRVAGIETELTDAGLAFRFASPQADALKLARPVPHPWLPGRRLTEIGDPRHTGGWWEASDELPRLYRAVVEANDRVRRMRAAQTPKTLVDDATAQLETHVRALFDALLTPVQLRLGARELFSARAVLAPAADLTLEQIGMPEEMAWALFGPLVMREIGDGEAIEARSERASQVLDAVMARSWVIINRAPTLMSTALLAFHPVRTSDDALHLHPALCRWLDADFDGDQAAVFLPVTEAAQQEAGERLSVAGHLARDPGLLASLAPALDALWGLAKLSLDPAGPAEISEIVGQPVNTSGGFVTATTLADALSHLLSKGAGEESVRAAMQVVERLMRKGFEAAKVSGASLSPFVGGTSPLPSWPDSADPALWRMHVEAVQEALAATTDTTSPDLGPQILMIKARGAGLEPMALILDGRGPAVDEHGRVVIVRHGYSEGLTPEELFACVAGARRGLAGILTQWAQMGAAFRERNVTKSFSVLTRALRAKYPGLVFARAAAAGEVDPLVDVESRMLVGVQIGDR